MSNPRAVYQRTTHTTRYSHQLFARLDLNARLFHDLRRPLPVSKRAVAWNIRRMEDNIHESSSPTRYRKRFQRTMDRVKQNVNALHAISQALHYGRITPKGVFMRIMNKYVRGNQADQLLEALHQIPEKEIQVRIDWMGPHFYIPKKYYSALAPITNSVEAYTGISMLESDVEFETPNGIERLSHFPFSLTLTTKGERHQNTTKHERWHDFEKVSNTLKTHGVNPNRYTTPQVVRLRIEGWFQNELGATAFGDEYADLVEVFPSRIKSYIRETSKAMQKSGAYRAWKRQDWERLKELERKLVRITRTIRDAWIIPVANERDELDDIRRNHANESGSKRLVLQQIGREVARRHQHAFLMLATIVSTTPIDEIEERVREFAAMNPVITKGLPHRRFPRKY